MDIYDDPLSMMMRQLFMLGAYDVVRASGWRLANEPRGSMKARHSNLWGALLHLFK